MTFVYSNRKIYRKSKTQHKILWKCFWMKKKTEPSDEYSLKLIQENYYSPSLTKRKINLCFRTRLVTPLSPLGDCTKLVSRRLRGGSFEKQALSLTFDYLFLYDMVICLCVRGLIPEKVAMFSRMVSSTRIQNIACSIS